MSPSEDVALIEKKILYAGTKSVPFTDGTKVKFHFQTKKCDAGSTVIDDSRKLGPGEALELVLGKKFKLEVWEAIVQKMALNEVAQFTVDKSLVGQYPFVSKTLRDLYSKKEERTHTCAMTIQTEGLGYDDLNDLLQNPCNLEFTIELVEVRQPEDYDKETWQMTEDERINLLPHLREKGNYDFKERNYKAASDSYAQAIGILEQLMMKEKPHDIEWDDLNGKKVPFLLNYAQCKLIEGNFYDVIDHCTTVLKIENDNVKALFRRGKAHVGAWNPNSAKEDFFRVLELDPALSTTVKKELKLLDDLIRQKDEQDKEKLKRLF